MKIALVSSGIGAYGEKNYYNVQEFGLAKAMSKYFDEVIVYKYVNKAAEAEVESNDNVTINKIPTYSIGVNGYIDTKKLDPSIDVLVCFSDTQLSVPGVYRWAKKNNVRFYPYIGTIKSHSENKLVKFIINFLFNRNLSIFKKNYCFIKTPTLQKELQQLNVKQSQVIPVGIDIDKLNQDYNYIDKDQLLKKYKFNITDKVILFIGRMVPEKEPLKIVEIFNKLRLENPNYKLMMIGTGELESAVDELISKLDLKEHVIRINKIMNNVIWEIYRLSDTFINLNKREIFGMAILEAMFYECKVVAWSAPGPNSILKHGHDGYLVDSESDVIKFTLLNDEELIGKNAHDSILNRFTWDNSARLIYEKIMS